MKPSIQQADHFAALIETNRGRLARIARTYASGHEAEDLVQDMLLELWRCRDRFRGESSADTWLYRVALNTAISFVRKKIRARKTDAAAPNHTVGDPRDPQHLLSEFMNTLNDANRSTLLMFLEGFDHAQIAEVLGCNAGSVAVRLTRLKQNFEKNYLEAA